MSRTPAFEKVGGFEMSRAPAFETPKGKMIF
jgi:hypothetical protein